MTTDGRPTKMGFVGIVIPIERAFAETYTIRICILRSKVWHGNRDGMRVLEKQIGLFDVRNDGPFPHDRCHKFGRGTDLKPVIEEEAYTYILQMPLRSRS